MRNERSERRLASAFAAAVSFLRERSWNARIMRDPDGDQGGLPDSGLPFDFDYSKGAP
jgi:hypothetical protein